MLQLSFLNDNQSNPFERIKRIDEQGNECWFSRELQPVLGYEQWKNFIKVINKAKIACEKSGNDTSAHFAEVGKIVDVGAGMQREIEDYKLSRLACYLIAMNGNPKKQIIADAQNYFAAQTRRQEVADEKKQLESHNQAVTAYQLKGKPRDWSEIRVDAKASQKNLNTTLHATHADHKPDFGRVGAIQNQELFEMQKRDIVEYLGLLPSQADSYRDHLGKYALEALRMSNAVIVDKMKSLKRDLTTDEQIAIIRNVTRMVAPTMRDLAEYAQIDYLSGAPKDNTGKALISRNLKLLPKGE